MSPAGYFPFGLEATEWVELWKVVVVRPQPKVA
jgi:hypothetical protein